jgi:16S rRNA (cytosine1402-N4)-methyltransferase
MVKEVIESLHIKTGSQIIDATLGTGGHSAAIIEAGGKVLGIEADPKMLEIARERLGGDANLVLGNFSDIKKIAKENGLEEVDGILFDLGVSNLHLKEDERGFSFSDPSQELDMRLNPESQGVKASDLLNALDKTQLTNLFAKILNYTDSKRISARIVNSRPIRTVEDLSKIVEGLPFKAKLNPLTLPMLALRIAVNSELDNLDEILPQAIELLKKGGRLLVITFHSGEEKIVQKYMNDRVKVRLPGYEEINKNVRSRSAKLYIYEKN